MRLRFMIVGALTVAFPATVSAGNNVLQNAVAPTSLLITGIGIGTVWTLDIVSGKNVALNGNIFKARDKETDQLMWPHFLAEYGTAACAIVGAVGLYGDQPWAEPVTLVASGLITYTSVNSMAWVLSEKGRLVYAVPMMVGLGCAGISIAATF